MSEWGARHGPHPLCWTAAGWLAWRERLARVARQARAFGRFVVDRRVQHPLLAERRALVEEAEALGALSGRPRTSA